MKLSGLAKLALALLRGFIAPRAGESQNMTFAQTFGQGAMRRE
jgi:hypothetical protein